VFTANPPSNHPSPSPMISMIFVSNLKIMNVGKQMELMKSLGSGKKLASL